MNHHQPAVTGALNVHFQPAGAGLDRALEGGEGIFRGVRRVTAVGDDLRSSWLRPLQEQVQAVVQDEQY